MRAAQSDVAWNTPVKGRVTLKIAIVAHGITDQSLLGGPGRVAAEHARGLAGAGHEVTVCTSNLVWKGQRVATPSFALLGDEPISVKWSRAFSLRRWPGSLGPVVSLGGKRIVAQAVDWADVVHGHEWPHGLVQTARSLSQERGVPFVVQPHGSIQVRLRGWKEIGHRAFNFVHPVSSRDNFIAGTKREANEIRAMLGPQPAIFRLGNPVALPALSDGDEDVLRRRASWGFPDNATVILFAHRIAPSKGLDVAIRALAELPTDYCLAVVGQDGGYSAYSAKCRSLAQELELEDRIRFAGAVTRTEVDEVVLAADMFILPARHDIFPLMVMHALACKRPVVMSIACQSAEELEGSVLLVEPHPSAIAEAIVSLSEEKVQALTGVGFALMVGRYSRAAVVARLEEIYHEVHGRSRSQ